MRIYILYTIGFLILTSCSRDDIVLSATDNEIYMIYLYKNKNDFRLMYNGVQSAEGTYTLSGDTVFLKYNLDEDGIKNSNSGEIRHANEALTRKLFIDKRINKIISIDDKRFSADIGIDNRNE